MPTTLATALKVAGDVEWIWPGWIAKGYVTLIAGRKGLGKSTVALDLMGKRLLMGSPWPDGAENHPRPGFLLWLEAEAGQGLNAGRAQRMGVPLDRVQLYDPKGSGDPMQHFMISGEAMGWVEAKMREPECEGLVVDALSGIHGQDENGAQLGKVVLAFANLAAKLQKPIVILHHKGKRKRDQDGDFIDDSIESIRGSSAIVQYTRIVVGIECPNGDDTPPYKICQYANNLMKLPDAFGYTLSDTGVSYCDAPVKSGKGAAKSFAADWLRSKLSDGPKAAAEVVADALANGISERTLQRARQACGVTATKDGLAWIWSL